MLLLLHSVFMLSVVKMLLKGEVGGRALNSHEITLLIMENHGKIMELCFLISVGTLDIDAPYKNGDLKKTHTQKTHTIFRAR